MECILPVIDTVFPPVIDQESGKSGSEEERSRTNSAASLLSNGSSSAMEETKSKEAHTKSASEHSGTAMASNTDLNGESCSAVGIKDEEGDKDREDTAAAAAAVPIKPTGTFDSSFSSLPPSLAASLDPQQFKLEPPVLGKPHKITKESFDNAAGSLKKSDDPSDPFSGLDPLWSHKKPSS